MIERLASSPYRLTTADATEFWTQGVLGPLACDAPQLDGLRSRLQVTTGTDKQSDWRNTLEPQNSLKEINELAQHPSILHPVAQLLGSEDLSFFQARFRVKVPGRTDPAPWHQDVGPNNGGVFKDGTPVPSLTVWLSLDGADPESGNVVVLPGTHINLVGNWQAGFNGLKGLQDSLDTTNARNLFTPANHFNIFHSWIVHSSLSNNSNRLRSSLVLRYMDRRHAFDVSFPHQPCSVS